MIIQMVWIIDKKQKQKKDDVVLQQGIIQIVLNDYFSYIIIYDFGFGLTDTFLSYNKINKGYRKNKHIGINVINFIQP